MAHETPNDAPPATQHGPILFYDGECGLCARWVQFCLARDRHGVLRYAPLQGATYAALPLTDKPQKMNSVVVLDQGRLLAEAEAVLVSLVGGASLTLKEVNLVMDQLNRVCEHAQVIMGAATDPAYADRLGVTLVATRRLGEPERKPERAVAAPVADPAPPAAEFPIAPVAPAAGTRSVTPTDRPSPRYVAPPPELTPEQAEQMLARQDTAGGRRRRKAAMRQEMLPLEVVSKGRFAKSEPTIYRGEDLDTPTYIRRGMALN